MESEDELDMHDAHDDDDDSVDNEEDFYSGGDDDAAGIDSDDADVGDYEFVDNDSDDSDDMVSYRHQVLIVPFLCFIFCVFAMGIQTLRFCECWCLLIALLYSLPISISDSFLISLFFFQNLSMKLGLFCLFLRMRS